MGKRGPQSGSERDLRVVIGGNFGSRPEPLEDMADDEAAIWRETVASEPTDYFNTAALRATLKDYCRHRAAADKISEVLAQFKPEWLKSADGAKRYSGLLRMRDLEARGAADKATKLRMTNQSRYTPQAAATASRNAVRGTKPWEV